MVTSYTMGTACDAAAAKDSLAGLIEQALAAATPQHRHAIRIEIPIEPVEPLAWLAAQGNQSRGYWRGRDQDFELAGIGTADVLTGEVQADLEALVARLRESISTVHPNLRYFGGMRFNARAPLADEWRPFGAYRFVLPRFEVFRRGGQSYFACNIVLRGQDPEALQTRLLQTLDEMPLPGADQAEQLGSMPPWLGRDDLPSRETWDETMAAALSAIDAGAFEKVVLARAARLTFADMLDPVHILQRITRAQPDQYHFCFQPKADAAFIGVSPERLYRRRDTLVQTEALAGTRARGETPEQDEANAQALLASGKDRREQAIVQERIREALAPHCRRLYEADAPALLALPHCHHLITPMDGLLHDAPCDAALLRDLHPTPAVGGAPREAAMQWIGEHEPFDRGWYAGPIGWVSHDAAEFAVGIRSALVRGRQLTAFAGAGIVAGSESTAEWMEIEQKLRTVLAITG